MRSRGKVQAMAEDIEATAREESEESVVNHFVDDGSVEQTPGLPDSAGPSGPQHGGAGTKERVVINRGAGAVAGSGASAGVPLPETPFSGPHVHKGDPVSPEPESCRQNHSSSLRSRFRGQEITDAHTVRGTGIDSGWYGVRTLPDPADGLGYGWSRPSDNGRWRPSASAVGGRGAVSLVIQPELFAAGRRNLGANSLGSSLVSSTESSGCAPRRDG